jgi:hypothetical protein
MSSSHPAFFTLIPQEKSQLQVTQRQKQAFIECAQAPTWIDRGAPQLQRIVYRSWRYGSKPFSEWCFRALNGEIQH